MRVALLPLLALIACDDPASVCELGPHRFIDGQPPTGTWSLTWRCETGCDLPAPDMAAADLVQFGAGEVLWRRQSDVLVASEARQEGACFHAVLAAGACAEGTWLCLAGEGRLSVEPITWEDAASGRVQRWSATGAR